jgi:hypothetical protein
MIGKAKVTYLAAMFINQSFTIEQAKEILKDESLSFEVQRYLLALVTVLEAEKKGHELNLTRAFREVILTTELLINP